MADDRGPKPVGASLEHLLGSLNAPPVDVLSVVFSRWAEVVGEDLAQHCRPSAIDGERLVVTASNSTWASEVRWLEKALLDRVAAVAGEHHLTSVFVRVQRPSKWGVSLIESHHRDLALHLRFYAV